MAGLSLRSGVQVGGSYTPMSPAAAGNPSGHGMGSSKTIAERAYGISGTGGPSTSNVAAAGSVGLGIFATVALLYLWWSLPR